MQKKSIRNVLLHLRVMCVYIVTLYFTIEKQHLIALLQIISIERNTNKIYTFSERKQKCLFIYEIIF